MADAPADSGNGARMTGKNPAVSDARPWLDPVAVPYVEIDRVTKRFGAFTAVDQVSLDIYKGELFSLLGGSGCGKTTLLRMLAGFETPTSGSIRIDGVDMTDIPPYRRPVNMMFQSYALFPHMTVVANVGFGLRQEGVAKTEINDRVAEMLALVQLTGFEKRKPHQLSGGQRQRVALARSLIKRPKLLLLDEPLGALDRRLREQTQFELVNIQESLGITFVVVTHDQEEAMTLSSRIGVMDAGRIRQVDTPQAIYEFPQSRFVADFIGSVNLFEGRVSGTHGSQVEVAAANPACRIVAEGDTSLRSGTEVSVALRPEKIRIAKLNGEAPPADPANRLVGHVDEIAYLGDISIYHVRLDGTGTRIKVTQPNIGRFAEMPITWEDRVELSWGTESAVVLTQ